MAQSHYEVAPSLKRAVRGTLRRMVDAGRLQSVPNHANLFRLGGVVRQVSQEAGINWRRSKPGSASLDSRVGPSCSAPAFPPASRLHNPLFSGAPPSTLYCSLEYMINL